MIVKLPHLRAISVMIVSACVSVNALGQSVDTSEVAALGERIFNDDRFSHPDGDLRTSCASCHKTSDPAGARAFTEQLARSWHPWRSADPGRDTLRNTPTLLDVAAMPSLHLDGEFSSLQEQAEETLAGRNMGWLPDERAEALAFVRAIAEDTSDGESYAAAMARVFGVDPAGMSDDECLTLMAKALVAFMETLQSDRDTPYDAFIERNGFDAGPGENESAPAFGARMIGAIDRKLADESLHLPEGFTEDAVGGAKIFFRTEGEARVGNCVTCHAPPLFTDFAFHNTGVSQEDYDSVHGMGSFAAMAIPSREDVDGVTKQTAGIVSRKNPGHADLGRWNFAEPDEDADSASVFAAFKTPTLRELGLTEPYMHNGGYATVEQALAQKVRASELARAGKLRNGDPEMATIRLSEEDIPLLAAFLRTLTTAGVRNRYPSYLQPKADSYSGPRYGVQYPEEVTPNVRRRYNDPE